MSLNCGIIGLPNVGKSTLFQALTSAPAEAANYPFCTIEPNKGIVNVPDRRLEQISQLIKPQKLIPAITEFVDIAGLVKGASQGEGLGNQFLGNIRQVGAIIHVVRCFEDSNITHVHGEIDPIADIETINMELCFSDLETVDKKLSNLDRLKKSQDKAVATQAKLLDPLLGRLKEGLSDGVMASKIITDPEDLEVVRELHLITLKKTLFCCNVDEEGLHQDNDLVKAVKGHSDSVVKICGKLESEISDLEDLEEKREFLKDAGLEESGLESLIRSAYSLLDLETYFTAGEKEVRAWTFSKGMKAPEAAGVIHTDFQKGFIKAEIFHFSDLIEHQSEAKVKEAGKLRIEGKEYVVQDGDIIHFRFNV